MAACMQGAGCVLTIYCTVLMVSRTNTLGGVPFTYYVLPCVLLLWGLLRLLYWSAGGNEWSWLLPGGKCMSPILIIIFDPHQVQCCHPSLLVSMYCYYVCVLCFYQSALVPGKCHVRWKVPGAAKCFCATLNRFLSILNIFMNSKNMVSLLKFYFLVIPKYLIEFYPECFRVSAIISLGK